MENITKNKRLAKEDRILHVIKIAKGLFLSQGYSATSTAQIARESEIAEITLFRYFSTKRELFEAVIKPLVDFEEVTMTRPNNEPSARQDIFNILHKKIRFAKQERELVRLVIVESLHQPDLAGEFNPVANTSGRLRDFLLGTGLNEETSQVIVNLIMGLMLMIVFTPRYDERAIDVTAKLIESQIMRLINNA
ncbi:MAG: helix-turn-helix domain containing protein [Desulfitobacterium hafniense]|nr:helix-turn-helix domain containing protein [Desulfitobacterium hafniense]